MREVSATAKLVVFITGPLRLSAADSPGLLGTAVPAFNFASTASEAPPTSPRVVRSMFVFSRTISSRLPAGCRSDQQIFCSDKRKKLGEDACHKKMRKAFAAMLRNTASASVYFACAQTANIVLSAILH